MLAGLLTVVTPFTYANYVSTGDFHLIRGNSGIMFYMGNNPSATGAFKTPSGEAAARLAAVHAPAHPGAVLSTNPGLLDHAGPAPRFTDGWGAMREKIAGLARASGLPADGVVLVSATAVEREWCAAGKLAGMIPAERFFAPAP